MIEGENGFNPQKPIRTPKNIEAFDLNKHSVWTDRRVVSDTVAGITGRQESQPVIVVGQGDVDALVVTGYLRDIAAGVQTDPIIVDRRLHIGDATRPMKRMKFDLGPDWPVVTDALTTGDQPDMPVLNKRLKAVRATDKDISANFFALTTSDLNDLYDHYGLVDRSQQEALRNHFWSLTYADFNDRIKNGLITAHTLESELAQLYDRGIPVEYAASRLPEFQADYASCMRRVRQFAAAIFASDRQNGAKAVFPETAKSLYQHASPIRRAAVRAATWFADFDDDPNAGLILESLLTMPDPTVLRLMTEMHFEALGFRLDPYDWDFDEEIKRHRTTDSKHDIFTSTRIDPDLITMSAPRLVLSEQGETELYIRENRGGGGYKYIPHGIARRSADINAFIQNNPPDTMKRL